MVQGAGEDETPIGGEPDKGHRGVGLIYEGFQALTAAAVPDAAQPIIAAGDYEGAVPVEVYRCHKV